MSRWRRWWPMVAVCVAASCVWMVGEQWPGAGSTVGTAAVGCAVAAVGMGLAGWSRRGRVAWSSAVGGAMVVVGPALGMVLGSTLDAGGLALAMVLTAVVVAVADGALGNGELSGDALWPGLAAAVGMLLVLPVPGMANVRNDVVLVVAPVMTGVGCVMFRRSAGVRGSAAMGLAGAAVVFGVSWVVLRAGGGGGLFWVGAGVDGAMAALGLVALGRVAAGQYAARFVVVPLVVLVEGVVLMGSVVTWRAAACAGLLAVASVALLRGERHVENVVAVEG